MSNNSGAKKWLVISSVTVIAVFVICFCFVLRCFWFNAKILNPDNFIIEVPEGFAFEIKGEHKADTVELTGWNIIKGDFFLDVNNWVVLYNSKTGIYTQMPTQMRLDDAATAFANDGSNYSFGGFYSVVKLTDDKMLNYELCFAMVSQDKATAKLIHTGKTLQEVL